MTRIIQIERWGRDGIVALDDNGQLWVRPFERGWERLEGPPVEGGPEELHFECPQCQAQLRSPRRLHG